MPKYSQLDPINAIIASDTILVLHAGKVHQIAKDKLFAGYLTESQIDQKIDNVVGGGVPWSMDVQANVTLYQGQHTYPHNLGSGNFLFTCEDSFGKPINPEIKSKSATEIILITSEEITGCTLIFFG